jgi:hypothetical protein
MLGENLKQAHKQQMEQDACYQHNACYQQMMQTLAVQ